MKRLVGGGLAIFCLLGCQDERIAESGGIRQRILDSTNAATLGFEDVNSWESQGLLQQVDDSVEGDHALSLSTQGWTELVSDPLSSLGAVGSSASLQVRLAAEAEWGELRLVLVAPSLGLYWADIGTQELSVLTPGQFEPVVFSLEPYRSQLSEEYSDLRLRLVYNGPPATIDFDALDFDVEGEPPEPSTSTVAFSFELPGALPASEVAIDASHSLKLNDGVQVLSRGQARPMVLNMGTGDTNIGADTRLGSLCSLSSPLVRERASIYGLVDTQGNLDTQNGVEIAGAIYEDSSITPTRVEWEVEFADGNLTNVNAVSDESLPPGEYGRVQVFSGARLDLSSGVYKMRELLIEPDAELNVDTWGGAANLYVRDSLSYRGTITDTALSHWGSQILIGYGGTMPVHIESPLRAQILAPRASVTLASLNGVAEHVGSIFARDVEVHQHTTLVNSPSTRSVQQAQGVDFDDEATLSVDVNPVDLGISDNDLATLLDWSLGIPADRTVNESTLRTIPMDILREVAETGEWPAAGSELRPFRVYRDNPTFVGKFSWHLDEGATATGKYSHNFEWLGGTGGELALVEHSGDLQHSARFPLLPLQGTQSSDDSESARWWLRGGSLVPWNRYRADYHRVFHSDENVTPEAPLWLELDDQILVVPIVAVTLIDQREDIFGDFAHQDWSHRARALFDFIPPLHQDGGGYERDPDDLIDPELSDVTSGSEYPPDEIYAECGVQFQLVYAATITLPEGFSYNAGGGINNASPCDGAKSAPVWYNISQTQDMIYGELDPEYAAALRALAPILIAYGNMECSDFSGKANKEGRFIEVDTRRTPASHMTSHELSHVLLDLDGHASIADNINAAGPSWGTRAVTPSQCRKIRDTIIDKLGFPERYRAFNIAIGRTEPEPPPLPNASDRFPNRGNVPNALTRVCCEVDGEVKSAVIIACDPGSAHPREDCNICCVYPTGSGSYIAAAVPPYQCPDDGLQVDADVCADYVCCGYPQPAARPKCEAEGRTIESENPAECTEPG